MDRSLYRLDSRGGSSASPPPAGGSNAGTASPRRAGPRIGLIYNPRSHRNRGQDLECTERLGISVARPETREDIGAALAAFSDEGIDYLIINGGDGTVRDVLTMGQGIFGPRWPELAVLPKGKTNALNVDLGGPVDWNLPAAIAAYEGGRRVRRRPLAIRSGGADKPPILGFILGAGAFTLGTKAGQDAHRLGFFNSLAVAMTAGWGIVQALFGSDSNRWRRGTEMTVRLLPGAIPAPHSRHGDPARRCILFVSTLERMPVGVRPFGPVRSGLKLVLMDKPLRRLLLSAPVILAGRQPRWLSEAGYFQLDAEGLEFDIAAPFIVDGEAFPGGTYSVGQGPELTFVTA